MLHSQGWLTGRQEYWIHCKQEVMTITNSSSAWYEKRQRLDKTRGHQPTVGEGCEQCCSPVVTMSLFCGLEWGKREILAAILNICGGEERRGKPRTSSWQVPTEDQEKKVRGMSEELHPAGTTVTKQYNANNPRAEENQQILQLY